MCVSGKRCFPEVQGSCIMYYDVLLKMNTSNKHSLFVFYSQTTGRVPPEHVENCSGVHMSALVMISSLSPGPDGKALCV